ncbi:MAG: hypothetical protein LR015_01470 [Verrucomicrobia bacterium]|nr:hypothetical protein [Verrucomicrobiota bacterium]
MRSSRVFLPCVQSSVALDHLRNLWIGMRAGLSSPLPFAHDISWHLASRWPPDYEPDPDSGYVDPDCGHWTYLMSELDKQLQPDSGFNPATPSHQTDEFRLAWRGRDPFNFAQEWFKWSALIARPVIEWNKGESA